MAKSPIEAEEQKSLAIYLDYKKFTWLHVPNENSFKLLPYGLKPGFPDVAIFDTVPTSPTARGVAIELKRQNPKDSKVRPEQIEWIDTLRKCGWYAKICYGAAEAVTWLEDELGF